MIKTEVEFSADYLHKTVLNSECNNIEFKENLQLASVLNKNE
jgi:hypothetical protein